MTLAGLLAEHESWLAAERGLSANTLVAYRRDLAGYARFLASHGVDEVAGVGPETVAAYVAHLKAARSGDGRARLAPASVARALVAVRSFHGFCVDEGHASTDPSEDVGAPRVAQGIPKALTPAEVEALLAAVTGSSTAALRDRAILEVLYGTGLRISE
ncbi:MAG: site-specific integrase, partial [Acidimicrobiia bacterium]